MLTNTLHTTRCGLCGLPVYWTGRYWAHVGESLRHSANPVESPPRQIGQPPFLDAVAAVWQEFGTRAKDCHVFDWRNERTTFPGGLPGPDQSKVTCNGEEIPYVLACLTCSSGDDGVLVACRRDDRGLLVSESDGNVEVFVRRGMVQVSEVST